MTRYRVHYGSLNLVAADWSARELGRSRTVITDDVDVLDPADPAAQADA